MIQARRIYDKPKVDDGFRILVDRIWPRGLKKNDVKIDLWQKDIAPSASLRKWFNHDQRKWNEFKRRYYEELNEKLITAREACGTLFAETFLEGSLSFSAQVLYP